MKYVILVFLGLVFFASPLVWGAEMPVPRNWVTTQQQDDLLYKKLKAVVAKTKANLDERLMQDGLFAEKITALESEVRRLESSNLNFALATSRFDAAIQDRQNYQQPIVEAKNRLAMAQEALATSTKIQDLWRNNSAPAERNSPKFIADRNALRANVLAHLENMASSDDDEVLALKKLADDKEEELNRQLSELRELRQAAEERERLRQEALSAAAAPASDVRGLGGSAPTDDAASATAKPKGKGSRRGRGKTARSKDRQLFDVVSDGDTPDKDGQTLVDLLGRLGQTDSLPTGTGSSRPRLAWVSSPTTPLGSVTSPRSADSADFGRSSSGDSSPTTSGAAGFQADSARGSAQRPLTAARGQLRPRG